MLPNRHTPATGFNTLRWIKPPVKPTLIVWLFKPILAIDRLRAHV